MRVAIPGGLNLATIGLLSSVLLSSILLGCHTTPPTRSSPQPSPPEVVATTGVEFGPTGVSAVPYLFDARWQWCAGLPRDGTQPTMRVLADPEGAAHWVPVATLGAGLLVSPSDGPGIAPGEASVPLLPQGNAFFHLSWRDRQARVQISRAADDSCWLAVTFRRGESQERVRIEPAVRTGRTLRLWIPVDPTRKEMGYLAVETAVSVIVPDAVDLSQMVHAWSDVQSDAARGLAAIEVADGGLVAVADLEYGLKRPGALIYLGDRVGAPWIAELALVSSSDLLAEIALEVRLAVTGMDRFSLDLQVRRAVVQAVVRSMESLQSAERHVLRRQFGAVSSSADSLREIAANSATVAEFATHLRDENFIFLQSASPAVRLAAHLWLRERDESPDGYDPLAGPRERRAAIESALVEQQETEMP